jgi:hypothetical protein
MKIHRYVWIGLTVLVILAAAVYIVANGGDLFAQ